jgi:4-oxalocrotonate tautomerase
MPHVVVKLYPGRSEQQKARLTEQIVKDIVATLGSDEDSISVEFEEVNPADWVDSVYRPEIAGHWDRLYKKPGYNPL